MTFNFIFLTLRKNKRCIPYLVFLLTGCGDEFLTLEQAKNQHYAVRVENVDFNVPLLYHPLESHLDTGWEPPQSERETIDAIRIKALLPDMEMYNEKTANEFKTPGWGRKVMIMMTHYRVNWPYYFDGAYKHLIKLPEHPLMPGMFHYRDPESDMKDIFLSHDQPVRELLRVRCDNPELDPEPAPSPDCTVTTLYRNQFQLEYTFSLDYLRQWPDIDRKIKALLDRFIPGNSPA
ncbi:hypothetical protein [Methylomonas sp. UP202]|uniref:hypothetical protein n=1 Tax=Methylomonas sp. UP202 TaxID=3040943 RepID=UPI00247AD121|nr:hypothetical protein [Methylomonas sp. UP202]WGS87961.1 hypothetical protein QC632_09415 [Methylomonas sp. UP202]